MSFTNAELVAIRKYCGYGAKTSLQLGDNASGRLDLIAANLDADEEATVRDDFLVKLPDLEAGILLAIDNVDTASASVWTHNANELGDRKAIYSDLRSRLCGFLGIEPGPLMASRGSRLVRC